MSDNKKPRRDFIKLSAMTLGGVGAASLVIPFISSMNPGKDTLALASTEIDLTPLEEGQSLTVIWRGKPVFIKHRTKSEIDSAKNISIEELLTPKMTLQGFKKIIGWLYLVFVPI